ncbi:phage baseplate protein [Lactiplantibacillus mudanjiangensis]|uniref:LysM domain-containing protein n=1 Tax=Lactiplantibacillus mudanjiangensis TaxID=1296538 RepID=A0A660DWR7_9LACO|nr:LysM peptidoglycan-binding domain-containing protein [Lactiplantibacillus mudanjiangensis]VDG23662.1 hypothetical protein [Lactobacillus helveticus] [Lactiplantibacillus mudanjiangensis]VDG27805.1 hypothetical protein [Lactobacillus helveticus] [Lactiplantibacillus mudanjiangensis]
MATAKAKKSLNTAKKRYAQDFTNWHFAYMKYDRALAKRRELNDKYRGYLKKGETAKATKLKNHGLKSANTQVSNTSKKEKAAKKKAKTAKKKVTALKVASKIADKIAAAKRAKPYRGRTAIYPTKSKTGNIVIIANTGSEGEDNTNNITSYAIDHAEPTNDYSHRETKQITVEGMIVKGKMADARRVYNQLDKWNYRGTELTLRSHITYYHLILVSLNRNYTADLEHGMNVTLTFQFAYRGQLNPGKKTATTNKGTKQSKGNHSTAKKSIKIHAGDTYWGLAQKYKTTVAKLTKLNGPASKTMYGTWWKTHKLRVR